MKDGHLNDELHLAEMVSLMGPPPKQFLERSEKCRQYWDGEGKTALSVAYLAVLELTEDVRSPPTPKKGIGLRPRLFPTRPSSHAKYDWKGKIRSYSLPLCARSCAGSQKRGPLRKEFLSMSF